MKKLLSLALTLAMTLSMITTAAGAKDFTDKAEITYDEAIAVISEIGVVDGYADGSFNPTGGLTRGAAAKIICNMILGPTTASELRADTAPFKDVPTSNTFSGYIAYCAKEGIISGYADGSFRPTAPLSGHAFMKMLLGALGYDSNNEGYTGGNWSINVAKQAIGIGLNEGLAEDFNGTKPVTRQEAALYAFNTLKGTLVDYDSKITTNVNGVDVVISSGSAKPVNWSEGINADGNIKDDGFVQFAEEYFPKLVRRADSDEFMRPANNWVFDKADIGTYADTSKLVETYTTGVTGKDAYDLLKAGVIADNKIESYVDGKAGSIQESDLVRSNNENLAGTGDGVVTEVYLDTDKDVITFVSVNSYLAKATSDYSESKEYAPLNVFVNDADGRNYNVDVEDVAGVTNVKKDTFYQVNISYKDNDSVGQVAAINSVEVLEDSTVTKFSADDNGSGSGRVNKLTTGGEEYKANVKAFYDDAVLSTYNETLLTDNTYNVYVDSNGYFLGVDLFEGTKNYVFITGYDLSSSNISVATADASAIFLDGTMKTIKVNVKDTNSNIRKALAPTADTTHQEEYFQEWNSGNETATLNCWYTYTVDADGSYTLKPAVRMTATQYTQNSDEVIKTSNLSVKDSTYTATRVYGEDGSVFLTAEMGDVTNGKAITEVSGVYTGVQSVEIEIDTADSDIYSNSLSQIYTVYDSDYYIVGAVVLGDAIGSEQNLAYILSGAKSEEKKDDTYYWTFDAILNGEIQTLTAKSKYSNTIQALSTGSVMELRFDGDYVSAIKPVGADKIYTDATEQINGQDVYQLTGLSADVNTLNLQGRTMYITSDRSDVGLALASGAKAVTIQTENSKSAVKTEFSSVSSAISHLADADLATPGTQYAGGIYAILNSDGIAQWVVFVSDTELTTGNQGGGSNVSQGSFPMASWNNSSREVELRYYKKLLTDDQIKTAIGQAMGSPVTNLNKFMGTATLANGTVIPVNFTQIEVVAIKVDGVTKEYVDVGTSGSSVTLSGLTDGVKYMSGKTPVSSGSLDTVSGGKLTLSNTLVTAASGTDVELYTAVSATASGLTMALSDGTSVTDGQYVPKNTYVTVTGADTSANYRQFTVNGEKVGTPSKGDGSAKNTLTYKLTQDTTFAEVTGVMVKVDGRELGVYADSDTVTFTGFKPGAKFAAVKNAEGSSDGKLFQTGNIETVTENVQGFHYTVDMSGDADNGVIELVQVVEITFSGSVSKVEYDLEGGSQQNVATTNFVKVGTELTITGSNTMSEVIKAAVNGGGAAQVEGGVAGDGSSTNASAKWTTKDTEYKVDFSQGSV